MKQIFIILFFASTILFSCSNSPREYFSKAALNCNLLYGFAGNELKQELALPQEKLVNEKTMQTAPVTRVQVVKEKLAIVEANYQKIKSLGSNAAADEMVKASVALYEFVIPVYKKEYMELATLYDQHAAPEKIAAAERSITDTYEATFEVLYYTVIKAGTIYAKNNGIRVNQVNPSPSN